MELGVVEAVEELCSRRVTAVQYAEALLQRAAKHSCINAYAHVDDDQASIQCFNEDFRQLGAMHHGTRLDLLPRHTLWVLRCCCCRCSGKPEPSMRGLRQEKTSGPSVVWHLW